MCGIVGFLDLRKNKEKKEIVKKMADRIRHRGPDGEGYYVDKSVALGHRRLSIIDIQGGSQPMYSLDKHLVVVFNGEIYNYMELREELKEKGYTFQTSSDTEVLLCGYQEWKSDLPKHLRGMFAFALWDKQEKTLFCARDPFGIKPFYYYQNQDTFLFGSEIKSFLEHPDFQKEFNESLLVPYLTFSFTPTTETFFKGVYRLDPGHSLTVQKGKIKIETYYEITFHEEEQDYRESVKKISKVMEDSVNHHMLSDVEVGSFLSSGIDSSYIVSLAKPNKTYTVGYAEKKYDETEYAKDLTNRLGITNINKKITKEEYMKVIPHIMYHMDEPSSDPAAVALYFVSELASHDVKVVLSGEGADEFFGGYNSYREEVDLSFYNKIPFWIRKCISKVCGYFPEMRGMNFLVRRGQTLEEGYIGVNRVYRDKDARKLVKVSNQITNQEVTKPVYDAFQGESRITKMQAIDIHFWLIKDILQKADRMTMANSIEGRVPFIDKEVFEVASHLPFAYKVNKENTKVALRDAAKEVIPNASYKKKKLGFPVPMRDWMRQEDVYEEIKATLESETCEKFFDNKRLLKMLELHRNNKKDYYKKIWTVYCFLKWYEVFFVNA